MPTQTSAAGDNQPELTVDRIYDETSDFVWRNLQRLGVRDADLEDVLQEVFMVVHRKLHTYDRQCRLSTWVFGICLRVANRHRSRAHRRREILMRAVPEGMSSHNPEAEAGDRQALLRLERMLDALPSDKRATFVMFELERMTCEEIAELMSVPVGTVYSRLHAARSALRHTMAEKAADTDALTASLGGRLEGEG